MWKFGDYKHYTSLDLLASIFNIPSSKSDIDGSQVNAVYYQDKNLLKIKDYCVRDVVVLAQLYLKMKVHSCTRQFNYPEFRITFIILTTYIQTTSTFPAQSC